MSSLGAGRYEVEAILGQGGMGVVYQARDRESGRQVAIKCLMGLLSAPRWERFRREGEVTANLRHPGIVRVHDLGVEDDQPYLVCELIEGARSLTEATEELELRERVRLLRDAADALGAAHAAGVVHRDVKPGNLLVDAGGRVRVTDFGLARIEGGERLTITGTVLGTPSYMSPEQVMAERELVGPASDVWSLGVVLFELLTDTLPFRAPNALALGYQIVHEEAPDPRARRAGVPLALAAVCWRALIRDPERRYPDANALREDLDTWLAGGDPSALADFPRRRGLAAALIAGALAVSLGAWAALVHSPPVPPAADPLRASTPRGEEPGTTPHPGDLDLVALARLKRRPRAVALEAWLDVHPQHPQRPAALQAYQALRRGAPLLRLRLQPKGYVSGRFLANGTVVTAGWDAVLRFSLDRPGQPERHQAPGGGRLVDLVALPQGVAWLREGLPLCLLRGAQLLAGELQATSAAADAASGRLAAGGADGRLVLLDADSLQLLRELPRQPHAIWRLAVSPNGRVLAASMGIRSGDGVGLNPGFLLLFDLDSGEPLAQRRLPALARSLAFSHDGSLLALGTEGGQAQVCDGHSGEERYALQRRPAQDSPLQPAAHLGSVYGVAFSPDGTRLYSLANGDTPEENELACWELSSRQLVEEPLTPGYRLFALDLSPDGRRLLVGTDQGTVDLWATPYEAP